MICSSNVFFINNPDPDPKLRLKPDPDKIGSTMLYYSHHEGVEAVFEVYL
jgi:hypothetical protein